MARTYRRHLGGPAKRNALLGARGGYEAGRVDVQEMAGWLPRTTFVDTDLLSSGERMRSRARDLDQNNGWINGGLDRRVEAVIGVGVRLRAQPIASLLGEDADWKANWTRRVQDLWKVWTNDIHRRCDATQRLNFGALARLAYLNYVRDGEAIAEVRMNSRGARFQTNIRIIDPDRLETPPEMKLDGTVRHGVEYDGNGAPRAYHFRARHPDDIHLAIGRPEYVRVPAFGRSGRAKIVHCFNPRRVDVSRGISRLVEAMVPAKMLDRVDRAEVNAALLSAILSFFIKSPASTDDVQAAIAPGSEDAAVGDSLDRLQWYADFRQQNPISMPVGAQVNHLLADEDVVVPETAHPNVNYAAFQSTVLRKIASSFGLSYPQLSQDWAGINYSSARALLNEMWRGFLQDRSFFCQHFLTPIYAAWMEEAVALGDIEVPGGPLAFYRLKTELTMCEWIGPGRGSVDPLKEANANNLEIASGRKSTVEAILEQDRDPDAVLDEEAEYGAMRAARGLSPVNHNVKPNHETAMDEDATEDEPA